MLNNPEPAHQPLRADGRITSSSQPEALLAAEQTIAMQTRVAALECAVNVFEQAVACLDQHAQVVHMSRAMEALVHAGNAVSLSHGQLELKNQHHNTQLKAMIAAVLSGATPMRASRSILIPREGGLPLQLTVMPNPSSPGRNTVAASVVVCDPSRACSSKARLLRGLYKLSPVEVRVAELLTQGLTVRETAGSMKLTADTVRFHTKRIFAKTGTHRQLELVRLVLSLPSLETESVSAATQAARDIPSAAAAPASEIATEGRGRLLQLPSAEWMRRKL